MQSLGRPAGGYALFYSCRAAGTIGNLRWLRALPLFADLPRRLQPPFASAPLAVPVTALPTFTIYAAWAPAYVSYRLTGVASVIGVAAAVGLLWFARALLQPAEMFSSFGWRWRFGFWVSEGCERSRGSGGLAHFLPRASSVSRCFVYEFRGTSRALVKGLLGQGPLAWWGSSGANFAAELDRTPRNNSARCGSGCHGHGGRCV